MHRRPEGEAAVRIQYAALPYRFTPDAAPEILLVTTRQTRRWVIPKGWPIKGLRRAKSAAREAFEEAGVHGKVGAKTIGLFTYAKALDENGVLTPFDVKVYPLLVTRQSESWPEADQRISQWADPRRAASLVKEAGMKAIITHFARRMAKTAAKLSV